MIASQQRIHSTKSSCRHVLHAENVSSRLYKLGTLLLLGAECPRAKPLTGHKIPQPSSSAADHLTEIEADALEFCSPPFKL